MGYWLVELPTSITPNLQQESWGEFSARTIPLDSTGNLMTSGKNVEHLYVQLLWYLDKANGKNISYIAVRKALVSGIRHFSGKDLPLDRLSITLKNPIKYFYQCGEKEENTQKYSTYSSLSKGISFSCSCVFRICFNKPALQCSNEKTF